MIKSFFSFAHFFILPLVFCFSASASDEGQFLNHLDNGSEKMSRDLKTLGPEEIYRRSEIVFKYFKVESEPSYQQEISRDPFLTPLKDLPQYLKILDPTSQFQRFFSINGNLIQSFYDRDSKAIPEYKVVIPQQKNVFGEKKLSGLRIALDPGHMAGDEWDLRTGKFVESGGKKVSEGLIALQTALLLEKKLVAAGAEVLVTHKKLGAVSTVPYEKLDIQKFGRAELKYRSLETWFQNLLGKGDSEGTLGPAFKADATAKKLFSSVMRSDYYSMREDLYARDQLISDFKPDLTIVIHFDAGTRQPSAKAKNKAFAYVPGGIADVEFSNSESRGHFLLHLGKINQWKESVKLSQALLNNLSQDLRVPLATGEVPKGVKVAPGVYTRNLVLARRITNTPMAYLECLYYANLEEFNRLLLSDGGTMMIDNKEYGYPQRLEDLAQALFKGVRQYTELQNDR